MTLRIGRQAQALLLLVGLYVLVAVAYIYVAGGAQGMASSMGETAISDLAQSDVAQTDVAQTDVAQPTLALWQIALGNALIIPAFYLPMGLLGLWLAQRIGLPGVFRPHASPQMWFYRPLRLGLATGGLLVILDFAGQRFGDFAGFPHPPFPVSLLASLAAAVGEEILFRLFLMSLWAVIFTWLLRRWVGPQRVRPSSLGAANALAAFGFAAGHLGTAMVLANAGSPLELPGWMLAELILLNGIMGWVAGGAFVRDGLVAAAGVHFWADVVWHGLYGALV